MLIRTLLVTFIGGAMFHSVGFTQNQQSAKFTSAPTVAVVANLSPLIKTKINQTDYILPDSPFGLKKVITPVDYFFTTKKPSCANKICFGFVPIPAAYYQSENKKKEFFVATSLKSTGLMFRYWF